MRKRTLVIVSFVAGILCYSCGDQCFKCENIEGYPNSTICKDTWQTTTNDASPSWDEYQSTAVNAGCVKQ